MLRPGLPGRTRARQRVALRALYLKKHRPEHRRAVCVHSASAHCWRFSELFALSSTLLCLQSVDEFPLVLFIVLPYAGCQLYFYTSGMLPKSVATCTSPMTQELHPDNFLTLYQKNLCGFVTSLGHLKRNSQLECCYQKNVVQITCEYALLLRHRS